ncbi:MAG: hypothetical protein IKT97_06015 [Spirochaetia bacterium]|nr:hypothetical protein [Spirochaetia bacterium]
MPDISREAIVAKYTDKSRYKPEYIYGDVYVDEERILLSKKNKLEKEIFDRELEAAKRFSGCFKCEVFLLPEGDKQGNAIYIEKNTNPDAITLGIFIDFKQTKGTNTSITRQFERGIGQADAVLLSLTNEVKINDIERWINGKLKAMKHSHEGFLVVIENCNKNYKVFTIKKGKLSFEKNFPLIARRLSSSGN